MDLLYLNKYNFLPKLIGMIWLCTVESICVILIRCHVTIMYDLLQLPLVNIESSRIIFYSPMF